MTERAARAQAPAVSRAVEVLKALHERGPEPTTLAEIARATGSAKSSTLAVLGALVAGGLVRRTGAGYVLGPLTIELGGSYLSGIREVRRFGGACTASVLLRGRLVRLAALDGTDIVYLARHDGDGAAAGAQVGDRLPAASTAMGRAMLAGFTDSVVRARLESPSAFTRLTSRSTSDAAGLVEKLESVRRRGVAIEVGEIRPGAVGIGVGLPRSDEHAPRLAVGVTVPGSSAVVVDHSLIDGLIALASALTITRPGLPGDELVQPAEHRLGRG